MAFEISDQSLVGHLMVVDDALDPNSGIRVSARYAVEAGRPGVQRA